jgi:hypothetical protein
MFENFFFFHSEYFNQSKLSDPDHMLFPAGYPLLVDHSLSSTTTLDQVITTTTCPPLVYTPVPQHHCCATLDALKADFRLISELLRPQED